MKTKYTFRILTLALSLAWSGPLGAETNRCDFVNHRPEPGILWWAVAAVTLMQTSYWLRGRLQPPMPQSAHVVIGHLAAFVARLSFILASSTFAVMFLLRFGQLSLPPHRIFMVLALLFSLFCYTLELERLATALRGTDEIPISARVRPRRSDRSGDSPS